MRKNNGIAKYRIAPQAWAMVGFIALYGLGCGTEPKTAQELFEVAREHQAAGRLDDAVVAYAQAIELDPKMTAAHVNLGNVKLQLGAHDGALLEYEKALELDPDHFGAVFNSGIVHYLRGNFEQALEHYDHAIEINPDMIGMHLNRGTVFHAMNRLEDAIKEYSILINADPTAEDAYYSRGDAYFDLKQFEKALADYAHVESNQYTPFRQWIAYKRLGRSNEADKALSDYYGTRDLSKDKFESTAVYGYFLGEVSEVEFNEFIDKFEEQGNSEAVAITCFYMGCLKSLQGDEIAAQQLFERGTQKPLHTVSEYLSMQYALLAANAAGN